MDCFKENGCARCLCEYFTTVVRVTGVVIAVVLWIIAINALVPPAVWAGVYLIFVALVISILEGLFLFESCITSCCDNDGCCGKTWVVVRYLDNWKRSILYAALCVACFFLHQGVWTIIFAGVLIAILAVLYLVRTFYLMRQEGQAAKTVSGQANEFQNSGKTNMTAAEMQRAEAESRYYTADPPRDEEMGKGGDAGYGDLEARYPH